MHWTLICKAKHCETIRAVPALLLRQAEQRAGWTTDRIWWVSLLLLKERWEGEKNWILQHNQPCARLSMHVVIMANTKAYEWQTTSAPPALEAMHEVQKNQPVSSEITSSTRQKSGVKTSHWLKCGLQLWHNFAVTLAKTLKLRHTFYINNTLHREGEECTRCFAGIAVWGVFLSLWLFWVFFPSWLLVPQVNHCSEEDNVSVWIVWVRRCTTSINTGPSRGVQDGISDRHRINLNLITQLL